MPIRCGAKWRTTLRTFLAAIATAWVIETVGVGSGMPFGRYHYARSVTYLQCPAVSDSCPDNASATHHIPLLAGVPLIVLLAWFMMGYATFVLARVVTRRRLLRWLWATTMLAAWDLYLDPQFILDPHLQHGWWLWHDGSPALPGLPGIPVSNYLGWLLAAGVLQFVLHTATGREDAATPTALDAPTVFLAWTWLGGAAAVAVILGLGWPAVYGFIAMSPQMWLAGRALLHRGDMPR